MNLFPNYDCRQRIFTYASNTYTSTQNHGDIETNDQYKINLNTNNSTAGAVLVEANLSGTSTVVAQFLLQMHNKKIVDFKNEGQSAEAQHPQWSHSMADIKVKKDIPHFLR